MASLRERLEYVITVDAKQAVKSLDQVGKTADKELGVAEKKIDKLGGSLTKFGAGAMGVAAVAGAGLFKLGQAASNTAESINAVTVTFGEAADGVLKLSESAAKSVGMSKADFNALSVSLAGFAKQMGGDVVGTIDDMTTRIADFASVMNLDMSEAATVFQSTLAGETEAIRRYGKDVSAAAVQQYALANGISDSAATMTEAEKVQARYGLLMQQTSEWANDFANTSGSAANQQRQLSAELSNAASDIGEGLLPVMTRIVTTVGDVVGAFGDLPGPVKKVAGGVAGFATIGLGAAGAVSFMAGQVIKFRTNLSGLTSKLKDAEGGLSGLGAGAVAASVAFIGLTQYQMTAAKRQREFNDAISDLDKLTGDAFLERIGDALMAGALSGKSFTETFVEMGDVAPATLERVKKALEDTAKASGDVSDDERAALDAVNEAIGISAERHVQAAKDAEANAKAEEEYAEAAGTSTEAVGDATDASKRLSEAVKEQKSAFDIASEAADAFRSALDEALGGGLDYEEASQAVIEGLDAVTAAFQENGATLDINTEAGRANRDAIADQVENITDMAEALVQQGMSAEDAATYVAGYRQQLIDQAVASGVSQEAAEAYIDQLGLTPESIQTTIKLLKAEQTKAKLLEVLDGIEEIPPEKEAEIKTLIEDGKFGQAKRKLREFVDEDRSPQIKPEVDKDKNKDAKDKLKRLDEYPIEPTAKPEVDPTSKANVETELDELTEDRTVTIRVREVTERADGGITIANADGNFLPQDATIHNGGTLFQWGEPETGGEAFIPLSPAKRKRSLELWKRVGQYFGIMRTAADGVTAGPSSPGLAPVMPELGTEAFKKLAQAAQDAQMSVEDYFKSLVDKYDQQAEIYENMYELGKVDTESYIAWLEQKKAALVEYSDEWMAINNQIAGIQKDQADKAAEQAKTAIELAFDEAEAMYAVGEARRDMRASRAEFLKALDPKSEASDEDKDAAGRSYAQSIVETLAARASNRGIEKNTVRWAKFMRRGIQRQMAKQGGRGFSAVVKWLKNELSKIPVFEDDEDLGDGAAGALADGAGGGNTTVPQLGSDTVTSGALSGSTMVATRSAPAVVIQNYNAYTEVDNMSLVRSMEFAAKRGTL